MDISIKKEFVKEYKILEGVIENENQKNLLIMFTNRWNFLFRHYGYYNIYPQSVLGIGELIVKKINNELNYS